MKEARGGKQSNFLVCPVLFFIVCVFFFFPQKKTSACFLRACKVRLLGLFKTNWQHLPHKRNSLFLATLL